MDLIVCEVLIISENLYSLEDLCMPNIDKYKGLALIPKIRKIKL